MAASGDAGTARRVVPAAAQPGRGQTSLPPGPGVSAGHVLCAGDGCGPRTRDARLRTAQTGQGLASVAVPEAAGGAGSPVRGVRPHPRLRWVAAAGAPGGSPSGLQPPRLPVAEHLPRHLESWGWRGGERDAGSTRSPHTRQPQRPIGWQGSQARERLPVAPRAGASHFRAEEGAREPHAPGTASWDGPRRPRKMPPRHRTEPPELPSGGTSMRGAGSGKAVRGGVRQHDRDQAGTGGGWPGGGEGEAGPRGTGGGAAPAGGRARPLLVCARVTGHDGPSSEAGRLAPPPGLPPHPEMKKWKPRGGAASGTQAAPRSGAPAPTGRSEAT